VASCLTASWTDASLMFKAIMVPFYLRNGTSVQAKAVAFRRPGMLVAEKSL
jgi:hypothetical protein